MLPPDSFEYVPKLLQTVAFCPYNPKALVPLFSYSHNQLTLINLNLVNLPLTWSQLTYRLPQGQAQKSRMAAHLMLE